MAVPKSGSGLQVAERARQQDGVGHAVGVDELSAEELRVGAGATTVRWLGVQAGAVDGVAEEAPPAAAVAVAPGLCQMRFDLVDVLGSGVDGRNR